MKIGIAVATYGSVPYVDLQLHYLTQSGAFKIGVFDDSSNDPALFAVCQKYNVELHSTPSRMGWQAGDLQSYANILDWACRHGMDMVVKLSRRWVITRSDWLQELEEIRERSKGHTFSSYSTAWSMPFRTECFAMWVPPWMSTVKEIAKTAEKYRQGRQDMLVEGYMHQLAKDIADRYWNTQGVFEYRDTMTKQGHVGYAAWLSMLGTSRRDPVDGVVNHWTHTPAQFKELADSKGLVYPIEQWDSPNKDH